MPEIKKINYVPALVQKNRFPFLKHENGGKFFLSLLTLNQQNMSYVFIDFQPVNLGVCPKLLILGESYKCCS